MKYKAEELARQFHQKAAVLRQEALIKEKEAQVWDLAAMDVERNLEEPKAEKMPTDG